jgi:hypothetical protein
MAVAIITHLKKKPTTPQGYDQLIHSFQHTKFKSLSLTFIARWRKELNVVGIVKWLLKMVQKILEQKWIHYNVKLGWRSLSFTCITVY